MLRFCRLDELVGRRAVIGLRDYSCSVDEEEDFRTVRNRSDVAHMPCQDSSQDINVSKLLRLRNPHCLEVTPQQWEEQIARHHSWTRRREGTSKHIWQQRQPVFSFQLAPSSEPQPGTSARSHYPCDQQQKRQCSRAHLFLFYCLHLLAAGADSRGRF